MGFSISVSFYDFQSRTKLSNRKNISKNHYEEKFKSQVLTNGGFFFNLFKFLMVKEKMRFFFFFFILFIYLEKIFSGFFNISPTLLLDVQSRRSSRNENTIFLLGKKKKKKTNSDQFVLRRSPLFWLTFELSSSTEFERLFSERISRPAAKQWCVRFSRSKRPCFRTACYRDSSFVGALVVRRVSHTRYAIRHTPYCTVRRFTIVLVTL